MKGLKAMRLGLAGILATALLAVGAFWIVSQASAVSGTLTVSSPTIAPGGSGSVELRSNVPAPGLGAWTIDVAYDPTKVTVTGCSPTQGAVCNPNYPGNKVRIAGASANGLTGDTSLGTITFSAAASCSGSVPLTASTDVFADATIGNPQDITVTINQGAISCALAPTATTAPRIGPTGFGPNSDGSSTWLIVGLAGAGLALLAGFGALRLRGRAA